MVFQYSLEEVKAETQLTIAERIESCGDHRSSFLTHDVSSTLIEEHELRQLFNTFKLDGAGNISKVLNDFGDRGLLVLLVYLCGHTIFLLSLNWGIPAPRLHFVTHSK